MRPSRWAPTSGELAVSTLIKAAPTLAALEPDAYTVIGAALAQADAFPPGLAMGQVNDRVRGHEIDAEAGIAIVAGFAGAGTVEDQVVAGRELNAIVYWIGLCRRPMPSPRSTPPSWRAR